MFHRNHGEGYRKRTKTNVPVPPRLLTRQRGLKRIENGSKTKIISVSNLLTFPADLLATEHARAHVLLVSDSDGRRRQLEFPPTTRAILAYSVLWTVRYTHVNPNQPSIPPRTRKIHAEAMHFTK